VIDLVKEFEKEIRRSMISREEKRKTKGRRGRVESRDREI